MFYMRDTKNRLPGSRVCEPGNTFHPNRKPASPPQSDVKTIPNNAQESSDNLNARFLFSRSSASFCVTPCKMYPVADAGAAHQTGAGTTNAQLQQTKVMSQRLEPALLY